MQQFGRPAAAGTTVFGWSPYKGGSRAAFRTHNSTTLWQNLREIYFLYLSEQEHEDR